MKPSDQDLHCFPLGLQIHAYNWNAAGLQDENGDECSTLKYSAGQGSNLYMFFCEHFLIKVIRRELDSFSNVSIWPCQMLLFLKKKKFLDHSV